MMTEIKLLGAIAELIRQGGLLALVVIEGWIIFKLYMSREALYDRLIKSTEDGSRRSNKMTEKVTTALTKSTDVAERIEQRRYGLLTANAGVVEDDEDVEAEDEDEDELEG